MFDVDKFIQCVQENPALWEKGSKDYSDRNVREKSWDVVGRDMFDTWMEMTDVERQDEVKGMKNKWRHVRDNFTKYVNQGKRGDPASKKKKYAYAEALTFLLQTLQKRRTSGNIPDEEEDDDVQDSSQRDQADNRKKSNTANVEVSFKKPNALKSVGLTSFESKLLEKLDSSKTDDEDADKSFLLSLLPDFKKLNDEEKLDFRFHTLQFFRDVRRKNTQQVLSQPSSSFQYQNYSTSQHFPNYQSEQQAHMYDNTRPNISTVPPQGPTPTPSPVPSLLSIHSEES